MPSARPERADAGLRQLTKVIGRYGRIDLLCLDELGYLSLDRRGAELLFQVLTEREERASVAIATNEPFSNWPNTFTDPWLCGGHRRPARLRRPHHRDRHHQLPPRPHPRTAGQAMSNLGHLLTKWWGQVKPSHRGQVGLTFPATSTPPPIATPRSRDGSHSWPRRQRTQT